MQLVNKAAVRKCSSWIGEYKIKSCLYSNQEWLVATVSSEDVKLVDQYPEEAEDAVGKERSLLFPLRPENQS